MKKTSCDYCGQKFTKTDDYVGASLTLSYTKSEGDDVSIKVEEIEDLCWVCLIVVKELLRKAKRQWTK